MSNYIAFIRKADDSDFSVEFPDLPGCATAGRDMDEALAFAREALAGHLEELAAAGDPVPAPSNLEAAMADPEFADAVAVLVPAPEVRGKAVPVTLTMDEVLLATVDKVAGPRGRSRFFDAAVREKLART
ncbi:MAG: type II toxin-antitoxin system HicB family antitoxin [Kiloniellales bacterium]